MSTFDTTRWYRDTYRNTQYRPLVTEPDVDGVLPVVDRLGRYDIVDAGDLTVLAERHTFERRKLEAGDRFININGSVTVAKFDIDIVCWVIVEDEVTS